MFTQEILEYKDALTDDLRKPGEWIIAYLDPSMAWPVQVQKIVYLGQEFWIIPITSDAYPGVAVKAQGATKEKLREIILRFISVLSWIENSGASLVSFGGGSHLIAYSRSKRGGFLICNQIDLRYLPEITDPKAKLALALMREARGLKHIAYSFLTFWRVLEVAVGRNKIKTWVSDALGRITDHRAKEAIAKIAESGVKDVSEHLYISGRCAVAHAGNNPIIDPDQPEDSWRLAREIPLVEALAVLAIEERLGVQTASTIYREHLYELGGFKRLFGDDIVDTITQKKKISTETVVDLPAVDISLMNHAPIGAFMSMHPVGLDYDEGSVLIEFERQDGLLRVRFVLNFSEERLEFDIHNGLYGPADDDSAEWADIKADIQEFAKWYYLNGCLIISNSETGELIARKDEFIPVNVIVQPKGFDKEINEWREIADERRKSSDAQGSD